MAQPLQAPGERSRLEHLNRRKLAVSAQLAVPVIGTLQRERTFKRTETVKLDFLADCGLVLAESRSNGSLGGTIAYTGFDNDAFLVRKM